MRPMQVSITRPSNSMSSSLDIFLLMPKSLRRRLRFPAFVGFVLHIHAHYNFRILPRAFTHSCSVISNFSVSVSIRCINIPLSFPKIQSICLAVSSESEHDRRMIAIAFIFVRLLY
jgi:hypothetical protein